MKTVYFVQASYSMGNNAYLPYTCGCLAAYAWKNPIIASAYQVGGYFFLRDPVDAVLNRMHNPDIVAFSCYAWNYEYHKTLSAAIKNRWPHCSTIFGGHQILINSSEQMQTCSSIDFLVHGPGELPFEQLLVALSKGGDISLVPSVSCRFADGGVHRSSLMAPQCPTEDLSSPYLEGCFDSLLDQYDHFVFSATLETNRGCPHHCAFCDWSGSLHKLRELPMERISAEIEWFAKQKIDIVFCADSNFGLLPRDEAIVDIIVDTKRRTGYPKKLIATYDKGNSDILFRINNRLLREGLSAGATLAFQSMDLSVLANIGRKNLEFELYREVMHRYNENGIPAYAEFILGLPGETYDSFISGIDLILSEGLCASIEAFPCEVLPNSPMSQPEYIQQHQLQLTRLRRTQRHQSRPPVEDIPEYAVIVVGTATMPREDWVRTMLFADTVQAFHGCGLLAQIAIFLHVTQGVDFSAFYRGIISIAQENPQTLLGERVPRFLAKITAFSQGDGEQILHCDSLFGDIMYPLAEALFLYCATQSERFFFELPLFLRHYNLDADVQAELIAWQRLMVVLPEAPPETSCFCYDWNRFFKGYYLHNPKSLLIRPNTIIIRNQTQSYTWPDFARECVWYGRKRGDLVRKNYEVIYE